MRNRNNLLIVFAILLLLPYCITCFYAYPFADDFCFAWTASEKISFLQKFLNQYLKWNGRFTADVLANAHPLITGHLLLYQITLLLSVVATPIVFYFFMQQLIQNKTVAVTSSILLTLFYFNYQPNITEGIYWYIGVVNYHLGNLLLLVQLSLFMYLLQSIKRNPFVTAISMLLLFLSAGFNEIGAFLIPLLYFTIYLLSSKKENEKLILQHLFPALAASAFVFFSPGNFTRSAQFPEHYLLFHSLLYASAQTARFAATWMFNFSFVAFTLLLTVSAASFKDHYLNKLDWRLLFLSCFAPIFISAFIPYMATGILGQHRTINYAFLWFILLWIIFIIRFSNRFSLHSEFPKLNAPSFKILLLFFSLATIVCTGNSQLIFKDYRNNNFVKYKTEFLERDKLLLQNSEAITPLKNIPSAFTIVDAKGDSTYWVDKCMRNYYSQRNSLTP